MRLLKRVTLVEVIGCFEVFRAWKELLVLRYFVDRGNRFISLEVQQRTVAFEVVV